MNRTRHIPIFLVVLGATLYFLLRGGEIPDDPRYVGVPGYATYSEHCKRCHGGAGRGGRSERMAKRPVDLSATAFRDTVSAADIAKFIRRGKGRMEGFDEILTPAGIDSLARLVLAFGDTSSTRETP